MIYFLVVIDVPNSSEGEPVPKKPSSDDMFFRSRILTDHHLNNLAQESQQRRITHLGSAAQLNRVTSGLTDAKKKKGKL